MATKKKRTKGKKGQGTTGARCRERRFVTSTTYIAMGIAAVGMVGSLVLGAGVFGLWIVDPPLEWASYLVAAGGFGLGVALWFGQATETAVTVGDAGIGVEDGRDVKRVPWYEMESISLSAGNLVVRGEDTHLRFSVGANAQATSWILREARERVGKLIEIDVDKDAIEKLPKPSDDEGALQEVTDAQVAGLECAASGKVINLEDEARLCPRCGQVYHSSSVPETCVTCEAPLTGRTLRA